MSQPPESLTGHIRTMQIIAASLVAGSLIMLGIVLFLEATGQSFGPPRQEGALPTVSILAVIMLVTTTPIAFLLPGRLIQGEVAKLSAHAPDTFVVPASEELPGGPISDTGFLLGLRMTTMIIGMALFEGTSFLGSIAYLVEGRPLALAVSAAAILLLLLHFPTEGRVSEWLDRQQRILNQMRATKQP